MARRGTVIQRAYPGSESCRVTIPAWIIEQMGWKAGDKLEWRLHPRGDQHEVKVSRHP